MFEVLRNKGGIYQEAEDVMSKVAQMNIMNDKEIDNYEDEDDDDLEISEKELMDMMKDIDEEDIERGTSEFEADVADYSNSRLVTMDLKENADLEDVDEFLSYLESNCKDCNDADGSDDKHSEDGESGSLKREVRNTLQDQPKVPHDKEDFWNFGEPAKDPAGRHSANKQVHEELDLDWDEYDFSIGEGCKNEVDKMGNATKGDKALVEDDEELDEGLNFKKISDKARGVARKFQRPAGKVRDAVNEDEDLEWDDYDFSIEEDDEFDLNEYDFELDEGFKDKFKDGMKYGPLGSVVSGHKEANEIRKKQANGKKLTDKEKNILKSDELTNKIVNKGKELKGKIKGKLKREDEEFDIDDYDFSIDEEFEFEDYDDELDEGLAVKKYFSKENFKTANAIKKQMGGTVGVVKNGIDVVASADGRKQLKQGVKNLIKRKEDEEFDIDDYDFSIDEELDFEEFDEDNFDEGFMGDMANRVKSGVAVVPKKVKELGDKVKRGIQRKEDFDMDMDDDELWDDDDDDDEDLML